MDTNELEKLIELDESETLEFKKSLAEQAGFGVVFIRQKMEKLGAPTPDFESGSAHFVARLWARANPNLEKSSG